jgi:peptidase M23-like protein
MTRCAGRTDARGRLIPMVRARWFWIAVVSAAMSLFALVSAVGNAEAKIVSVTAPTTAHRKALELFEFVVVNGKSCKVSFGGPSGAGHTASKNFKISNSLVVVSFRVASDAAQGKWLVHLGCARRHQSGKAPGKITVPVEVVGKKQGHGPLIAAHSLHTSPRGAHEGKGTSKLPVKPSLNNAGGAVPADQYLPFATGLRIPVSQNPLQQPCGYTHSPTRCNPSFGPYNQYAWDFAVHSGTVVHASAGGSVTYAGFRSGGFGITISIKTPRGDCAQYEHLQDVTVHPPQSIPGYTVIGHTDNTGNSSGPHLHYGRVDCRTGFSQPSSFVDVGDPRTGSLPVSGNSAGGSPQPTGGPTRVCPPNCRVYGATEGVNLRSGPSTDSAIIGHLANNTDVTIACQTKSSSAVGGSYVWDRLSTGGYVADYYVNTPTTGDFSAGVAHCGVAPGRSLAIRSGGGYALDGFGNLHRVGNAPAVPNGSGSGHDWPDWDIARTVALRPSGGGGYLLDGYGGVHPFGGAPGVMISAYWNGWDIARSIALRSDGLGGYVLDGYGALHQFGGAPPVSAGAYWNGWDIARSVALSPVNPSAGYTLDGWGGIHPFGGAPAVNPTGYWKNWDIARAIALRPDGTSGYVLDGFGSIHPFGGAPAAQPSHYTPNNDDARGLALTDDGNGGWVLFTDGTVAPFGDASPISVSW